MGVTIKDVAEAAGVSISTVSKVLNGHYSISEKTAQRLQSHGRVAGKPCPQRRFSESSYV